MKIQTNSLIPASNQQRKAFELLKSSAICNLLYGGARSGKSAIIIDKQIARRYQFPESRGLAARLAFSHARTSLFHETIKQALKRYPKSSYKINKSDCMVEFSNGSELWIGGFDNEERVEKILGHEYADIYFNEVSQLPYSTILIGFTRLAQKIKGCINKAWFDCNPPSPLHWAYKLFIQKLDPKTNKPLIRPELYNSLRLNPVDNVVNLPKNYIRDFLEPLPEKERKRFLDGEFCKQEGAIYDRFDDNMIITRDQVPPIEWYSVGGDFGINSDAVLIGYCGECVYIIDEVGLYNGTASQLNADMRKKWHDLKYIAYFDPSGGERLKEIEYSLPAINSVEPGINYINQKIERKQFFVVDTCRGVLDEIVTYRRDDKERIVKENDHYLDAMRYGIFSPAYRPHWRPA
jgi:PBSX family phage terminase large subunit